RKPPSFQWTGGSLAALTPASKLERCRYNKHTTNRRGMLERSAIRGGPLPVKTYTLLSGFLASWIFEKVIATTVDSATSRTLDLDLILQLREARQLRVEEEELLRAAPLVLLDLAAAPPECL